MGFDGKAFGEEIVASVRLHVAKALEPITARLDAFAIRLDALAARDVGVKIEESAIVARAVQALIPVIDERVREAVEDIPVPSSVTIDDVRPIIETEVAAAVARLQQAKPQRRFLAAMKINRSGSLIATMNDGWLENIGPVVEYHAHAFSFESAIADGVKALPAPPMQGSL